MIFKENQLAEMDKVVVFRSDGEALMISALIASHRELNTVTQSLVRILKSFPSYLGDFYLYDQEFWKTVMIPYLGWEEDLVDYEEEDDSDEEPEVFTTYLHSSVEPV